MTSLQHSITNSTAWSLSCQNTFDESVQSICITSSPFTVGRESEASLTLADPTVSGLHAELKLVGQGLVIRDLDSTNGTFVNGARLTEDCELNHGDLIQCAQTVFRVALEEIVSDTRTVPKDSVDRALSLIQFETLVTERKVCPYVQPIIELNGGQIIGYEALGRSKLLRLSTPKTMFAAARILKMEDELSRILRDTSVRNAEMFPTEQILFLNTHPAEMRDVEALYRSLHELRNFSTDRPLVLEIHEKSVTDINQMRDLRELLNSLNIGLAYDDFGAGQARLVELSEVPPDYLKFDINLISGIGTAAPERITFITRLVEMVVELGIKPLAEGVETKADHRQCAKIGFEQAQGFYYGHPLPPKEYADS